MQALKYSLRLMLCWPVLAMLGGLMVISIVLALLASLFMASLTWQAALLAGFKFGGIFVCALWAMFFIKTFTAVTANGSEMLMKRMPDKSQVEAEDKAPPQGGGSRPDQPGT